MSSENGHTQATDPSRRLVWGAAVAGLLILAGVLCAKPIWRALRAKQAKRFITQALVEKTNRNWGPFVGNLRAANELDPNNPTVLRLNAEHYARYGSSDGLTFWYLLQQSGHATKADQLGYARLALACDLTDLARTILKPLHYGDPTDADVLVVLSELFEREGDLPQATAAALDAITRNPRDSKAELRLAKLELAGGTTEQRRSARSRLYALLSGANSIRTEAALTLLIDDQPGAEDLSLIARLLSQQPSRSLADRLATVLVELRQRPFQLDLALTNLTPESGVEFSPQERAFVVERLGAAGQFKAVLKMLPEAVALTNRHFAVFRLGALASTRELSDMERFLKSPDLPLPPAFTATFKATLAALANRTNEAPALWRSALAESAQNPTALRALALQSERAEAYDVAVRCWEDLMGNTAFAPFAAKQLLRIGKQVNDPRAVYVALRRLFALNPDRPEIRLPLAYYQALLDLHPAETERLLSVGSSTAGDLELFTLASALYQLRLNDADKAAELLENGAINWTNAPPSWVVVRVAALGRSGNGNQARTFASQLNRDRLSAQESALVEPWLTGGRNP